MTTHRQLGQTDLRFAPLVLGTNVMGWTADEATSFSILDAFLDEGFSAIDTADVYSRWVPGNDSESERIIGRWVKARGNRDRVQILTKVGSDMGQGHTDLSAAWIEKAVEDSLKRLQTDYIDLYQSHWPDDRVAQDETLGAYQKLIEAGKVRWIGASNYAAPRLSEALRLSAEQGLPRYQSVQNQYNLIERGEYEGELQALMQAEGLSLIPYFSLGAGYLTGKYRSAEDLERNPARAGRAKAYHEGKGPQVLAVMDQVAEETGAALGEIALAWVTAQAGVIGPLASATSVEQLAGLARGARLTLSADQLARLDRALD